MLTVSLLDAINAAYGLIPERNGYTEGKGKLG